MKPSSHKDGGAIGVPGRHPSSALLPAAAEEAYRYSRKVSQTSAEGVFALAAFAANQALTRQIEAAHTFGRFAHAQSRELDASARRTLPAGPMRDAVTLAARMQSNVADTVESMALQWGRRFGRLAFAFALPDRGD